MAAFETHRKYVDIQAVLMGRERIEVISRDRLSVDKPYDETKDLELYLYAPGQAHLELYPGTFALFFPHDAHMPGLMIGQQPEFVKKVVIKIKTDLLIIEQ